MRLKDITEKIGSGATPKGGKNTYLGGDISLIRSQNVLDYEFSNEGLALINDEQASKLDNVTVREGDVLLNITGDSVARCCLVPKDVLPARVNQHVSIIRPKDGFSSDYLMYWLLYMKRYLLNVCRIGGTRNALTKEALEELEIEYSDDARSIARVLKTLDNKIANSKKIIKELEETARLIYDFWFTQFDFPDENGKPYRSSGGKMVWSDELKREIPEGWEVGCVFNLGEIVSGATPSTKYSQNYSKQGIAWITPNDLSDIVGRIFISHGEKDITSKGFQSCSAKMMPAGSVIISSRAPIGYLAIASNRCCTNQGCKSIIPNKGYGSFFIFQTIRRLMPFIKAQGVGTIFSEISKEALGCIKLSLPPVKIASRFEGALASISEQIQLREKQIDELASLRDWLLPMLMNGQAVIDE